MGLKLKSQNAVTRDRILVIAPQPFYEDRGTPIAVRRLLEALAENGKQIDLLTYPVGMSIELPSLRIFRVGSLFPIKHVPIGFSVKKLFLDALLIRRIINLLKQENYSCIHAVEEIAFPALIAARRFKIPLIYDMQSSLPQHLAKHWIFRGTLIQKILCFFERWLIRHVDFVVCSAGLKNYVGAIDPSTQVAEWFFPGLETGMPSEEVAKLRRELNIPTDSQVVMYTGNFAAYQGITKLAGAIAQVITCVPRVVFVFVGAQSRADFSLVRRYVGADKLKFVRVIPRQPRQVISRYLAIADVLVSPRDSGDNLPLKIFDYIAAGKPIVATDSLTHRMVLSDDRAVLVLPTAEAFANAIIKLLRDPALAERITTTASAYWQEKLGWIAFSRLVRQIYEQVQAGRRNAKHLG